MRNAGLEEAQAGIKIARRNINNLRWHHPYGRNWRTKEPVDESERGNWKSWLQSVSSVAQSCPTLRDPVDHSMAGLPVRHQLPELTQTHVHWVGDATQSSHSLSSPPPPAFNLSQHQGLFKWVSYSQRIGVSASASVLPMNIQDWFPLGWTGWISLQSKGLSRIFSNTTVQKHQFFTTQLSLWSNSHIHTWLLEKNSFD